MMQAKDNSHQSLDARLAALDRRMDQIAGGAAYRSVDDQPALQSQLSALRTRLTEVRTRLREKGGAYDRASDAAAAEIGREFDDFYEEYMARPE